MRRNAANIQTFADDLENFIAQPPGAAFGLTGDLADPEIEKIFRNTALVASITAAISKQIEFYMNGDINKEIFLKRYKEIENESETKLANIAE